MTTITDNEYVLLRRVQESHRRMLASREEWSRAVETAAAAGIPTSVIAGYSNVTEAAIRMKLKRAGQR